nr:MAG TPA: hypothetical protein [Caudoviricetes sp.]
MIWNCTPKSLILYAISSKDLWCISKARVSTASR